MLLENIYLDNIFKILTLFNLTCILIYLEILNFKAILPHHLYINYDIDYA